MSRQNEKLHRADRGEHAELLNSILVASESAIAAVGRDGSLIAWSSGAERIFGYDSSDAIGCQADTIFATIAVSPRWDQIVAHARERGEWSGEARLLSRDGKRFSGNLRMASWRDAAGRLAGFTIVARDLSAEKQAERAIREQQAYSANLFESNVDAIVTTDSNGIVTGANQRMCTLTGRSREELIGTRFADQTKDPVRADEALRRVLGEGTLADCELAIRGGGDAAAVVSCNATILRGADDRIRGVFVAARDISARKRLEDELRRKNDELEERNRQVQEANRLKSEFLANMSHELRTPLNAIIGFSELIFDGKAGALSDDQREYLADILTSGRHLLALINDVLDLSKVEAGKMEFLPERVELAAVAAEVRDILRSLAGKKRIAISTEVDRAIGPVTIDPGRLKQVLYNFLSNALKFTPDGGKVTIRIMPAGETDFTLEVEDTGIGISHEDLTRLFVEFQQLDASTAKKYQGTGLGLALTKRIVEAQGGEIGARSEPGRGSVFSARLARTHRPKALSRTAIDRQG
ncbi:MAG TPA: PAS domain S-box protein [Candidatus Binataceae bacterium]|nr:PAS domain S-box protein [Candidatus Binataceae bacterium]